MSIYHDRRLLIPFRSTLLPQIFTDTLVIGTGVAGLRACVEAARHGDVILLAKEAVDLSNTSWAQGGIAAVLSGTDTLRFNGYAGAEIMHGLLRVRIPLLARRLVQAGVPAGLVTSEGKAATEPIGDNATKDGRARNRRVEIVLQKKV